MRPFAAIVMAALLGAAASTTRAKQDRTADLRSRFEHETNPVQRAKLMPDLGEAEFRQIRAEVDQDDVSAALNLLREYKDQVDDCMRRLASTNVNPERHPAGFKQLQIAVRESLGRIDALLPQMTGEEQAPFLEIRKSLDGVNRRLIEQLFPGRTSPPPKPDKAVQ